jgi:hypothetical protein
MLRSPCDYDPANTISIKRLGECTAEHRLSLVPTITAGKLGRLQSYLSFQIQSDLRLTYEVGPGTTIANQDACGFYIQGPAFCVPWLCDRYTRLLSFPFC